MRKGKAHTRKVNKRILRKAIRKVNTSIENDDTALDTMNFGFNETKFQPVNEIEIPEVYNRRFKSNIDQLDMVMGEGFLPGSAFTITGEAGAGKTRLMLQLLNQLSSQGKKVAYASGEESECQLAFTCRQLGVENLLIAHRTDIDKLVQDIHNLKLDFIILDSFQCMTTAHCSKPKQIETYVINTIINAAKNTECVVGIVMHMTKQGKLKGSTLIPHSVDMNMQLLKGDEELYGTDQARECEIYKNRFGGCGTAVFYMTPRGFDLETDINRIKEIREQNKSGGKRNPEKQNRVNAILEKAGSSNGVTVSDAVAITGNYYSGRNLLKELECIGKLIKVGRGSDAYYTQAPQTDDETTTQQ